MHLEKIEFNGPRKIWHSSGSLLMVAIFFLGRNDWRLGGRQICGIDFLVMFAWLETVLIVAIDVIRYYFPAQRESIRGLPLFGKWLRKHEEESFNSATYFVLASAILITAYKFGQCRTAMLVAAILVLGLADPTAAFIRHQLEKRRVPDHKVYGLLAFALVAGLIIALINSFDPALDGQGILAMAIITALVETYTPPLVVMLRPLTSRLRRAFSIRPTELFFKLYLDDNITIPLLVWVLSRWFAATD